MAEGSWVPVFYEDLSTNYREIWEDDRAAMAFIRLLALADKVWPNRAELPARVSRSILKQLTDSGLVKVSGATFRIPAHDKRREQLSASAQNAAEHRWSSPARTPGRNASRIPKGNAGDDAGTMPTHTHRTEIAIESDSDESSSMARNTENNGYARDPEWLALQTLAEQLTQQPYALANPYGGWGARAITDLHRHGLAAVSEAWRKVTSATGKPTVRQLILGADDILNPVPDMARAEKAAEDAAKRKRRDEVNQQKLRYLRGE